MVADPCGDNTPAPPGPAGVDWEATLSALAN
ncbi:hypothetical protein [Nonomuraea dietziae]